MDGRGPAGAFSPARDPVEFKDRVKEEAARVRRQFLANMSHELRTPLNQLLGLMQLLGDGVAGGLNEQQREMVKDAEAAGRHLLTIVEEVLDLSQLAAGNLRFRPRDMDVEALLVEARRVLRAKAQAKDVEVRVEAHEDARQAHLDPNKLMQVVYNLVQNAVKFTPPGGHVVIRSLPDGDDLRIEVEDDGIGIHEENLGTVFEGLRQIDEGFAKRHGGAGIGLAVVRRMVEAQGGEVGVTSRLGEGSTFHVTLPRRHQVHRRLVLVAVEDRAEADVVERVLEEAYDVIVATDIEQAFAEVQAGIDAAVVEFSVLREDVQRLVAMLRHRRVPLLALGDLAEEGLEAMLVLPRPLNEQRLRQALERWATARVSRRKTSRR